MSIEMDDQDDIENLESTKMIRRWLKSMGKEAVPMDYDDQDDREPFLV